LTSDAVFANRKFAVAHGDRKAVVLRSARTPRKEAGCISLGEGQI
jgi:hypothetical protein